MILPQLKYPRLEMPHAAAENLQLLDTVTRIERENNQADPDGPPEPTEQ